VSIASWNRLELREMYNADNCHTGLARTDNNMDLTSWPQVNMINQKNYCRCQSPRVSYQKLICPCRYVGVHNPVWPFGWRGHVAMKGADIK
jgi:hypothetical protein